MKEEQSRELVFLKDPTHADWRDIFVDGMQVGYFFKQANGAYAVRIEDKQGLAQLWETYLTRDIAEHAIREHCAKPEPRCTCPPADEREGRQWVCVVHGVDQARCRCIHAAGDQTDCPVHGGAR